MFVGIWGVLKTILAPENQVLKRPGNLFPTLFVPLLRNVVQGSGREEAGRSETTEAFGSYSPVILPNSSRCRLETPSYLSQRTTHATARGGNPLNEGPMVHSAHPASPQTGRQLVAASEAENTV